MIETEQQFTDPQIFQFLRTFLLIAKFIISNKAIFAGIRKEKNNEQRLRGWDNIMLSLPPVEGVPDESVMGMGPLNGKHHDRTELKQKTRWYCLPAYLRLFLFATAEHEGCNNALDKYLSLSVDCGDVGDM
jgi:hypothetical protein